ncbi:hypothetical protein ACF3MZ_15955 [Paenibacillaceae bacterium WGS1546]
MRQLLMAMLLVITVVLIYASFVQGDEGANAKIRASGGRMADQISRISP